MTDNLNPLLMSPDEIKYINQLHKASKAFQQIDGHWQFKDQLNLYGNPHLKSLAECFNKNVRGGDYDTRNTMNAIYSEILIRGFFNQSPEEYIQHFMNSLGGDNGVDGVIQGVNYDVKVTEKGKSSRVKKSGSSPWVPFIYIFTALDAQQRVGTPEQVIFKINGYAWHNEALPHFYEDVGYNARGHRVSPGTLATNGVLVQDLARLRDGSDQKLTQKIRWDSELRKGVWITEK